MTSAPNPPRRQSAPIALYVHVPFCRSLCPYCDFVVYAGSDAAGPRSRVGDYLRAVSAEIALRADAADEVSAAAADAHAGADASAAGRPATAGRPPLASLYFGGGTPSMLPADEVAALIALVDERFGLAPGAEITLEANPGPDDRGDLAGFARAGVNRISIGAQSMVPAELRALGRRHRPSDVVETVARAREAGIAEVSLDLLYDVPGQTLASWTMSLEEAVSLAPDHLSAYALTLDDPDAEGLTGEIGDHLPTPPGARRWRDSARGKQDEDRAAGAYGLADAILEGAGLPWYELSNWARPGSESRHNLVYWQRLPYEAVGPGAHAFDGRRRRWNAARLNGWVAALAPSDGVPALPPGGWEEPDEATAAAEELILGLRTVDGISSADALSRFDVFGWASENGLVEEAPPGRVRLTLRGRLLSNELFSRLV